MLITGDGDFQGMLSGGCLEGDLAERARMVLQSGLPQVVTYDLGKNDEELWGLGVGCDGLMRIFLQPLLPESGYEPFATMARAFGGVTEQVAATVIESDCDDLRPGETIVTIDGNVGYSNVSDVYSRGLDVEIAITLQARRSEYREIATKSGTARLLFSLLMPPPAILVLGAGLDAGPVVRFASELGWRVTVQDHRSAYIESGKFLLADQVHCVPVAKLAQVIDFADYAAAIVMSHHLSSDREYLRQLARSSIAYVGLLGPIDRRNRLLAEIGDDAKNLAERVHGPAGLKIGGRGPASIALSIIAEIHQELLRESPA